MVVSHFDDNLCILLNVSLETRVEAIPGLLHDLFDRLSQQEIIPFKPDYCVIDIFSEVICFHYSFGLGQGQCMFTSSRVGPLTVGKSG